MNSEQLGQFIKNYAKCQDNQQRDEFEIQIKNLVENCNNLQLLLDTIVLYQNDNIIVQIAFKFLDLMKFEQFEQNQLQTLNKFFHEVFFQQNIQDQIIKSTSILLENYLKNPVTQKNTYNSIDLQKILVKNIILKMQNDIDITKSIGTISILNIIIDANSSYDIENLLKDMYHLIKTIEEQIFYQVLNSIERFNLQNLNQQQQIYLDQCLRLIELFSEFFNIVLRKKMIDKNFNIELLEQNQKLMQTFANMLVYDFLNSGNKLSLTTQNLDNNHVQRILKTKTQIVTLFLGVFCKQSKLKIWSLMQKFIFNDIINNLIQFFSSQINLDFDIRKLQSFQNLENYVKKLIVFVGKNLKSIENFQKLNEKKFTILVEIFFKAFYQTEVELDNIKNNQNEFHNNLEDLIVYQNSTTVKSFVIKLFQNFISKIDGTALSYFKIALEIIYYNLEHIQKYSDVKYENLQKIKNSTFFNNFSQNTQIEIALTILLHLHEHILKRNDMKISMDFLLKRHMQNIIESSQLNQIKLIYLLQLIIDQVPINANQDAQFKKQIVEWILTKSLGNDQVSFYAGQNLSIIKKSKLFEQFGEDFLGQYLKAICQQQIQCEQFSKSSYLLQNFIENNQEFLFKNELNFMLIMQTIERSIRFLLQNQQFNNQHQIFYNIKLFDYICSLQKLLEKYVNIIEESFQNIYNFIITIENADDITDHLVSIYVGLTFQGVKFQNLPFVILENIYQNQIKDYMPLGETDFSFMTLTLYHYQSSFDQYISQKYLNIVMEFLKQCLKIEVLDIVHPLLLLQVFILEKGDMLTNQNVKDIYQLYLQFLEKYQILNENEEFIHCIILALLQKKQNLIISLMQDNFQFFVKKIIEDSILFSTYYDIKIFHQGLIQIFQYLYQRNDMQDLLIQVFKFIILHFKFYENQQLVEIYFVLQKDRQLTNEEKVYFENQKKYIKLLGYPFKYDKWYLEKCPEKQNNNSMDGILNDSQDESFDYFLDQTSSQETQQSKKLEKIMKLFTHNINNDQYQQLNEIVQKIRNDQKFIELNAQLPTEIYNITNDVFFNTRQFLFGCGDKLKVNIRKVVKVDYSVFNNQL